jgi:hypothetical protein
MAQTKTRSSTRSSSSQKSKANKAKGKSSKPKPRSRPKAKSTSSTSSGSNGSRAKSALETVEHTAKDAGGAVGKAASKAKLPLVAGGAALAGAVGGMAVGAHQARRHKVLAGAMARRPMVKVDSHDLAGAAKRVGTFGAQMGRLASELQQAREGGHNNEHRSPLEVVLEGLTARRSRS